jgi:glyoxylate/hydroxypyruvate reductase A
MRIVIAHNVPQSAEAWRAAIAARLPESTVGVWPETLDGPADYAIGWQAPPALFQRERRLRAFFVAGAGVNQVLAIADLDPGLPIVRLEDAGMARQIARYCLAAVLGWCDHRETYDHEQRDHVWNAQRPAVLSDWPIGIFGLGQMGRHVAGVFALLGFPVHGYARSAKTIENVRTYVDSAGSDEALAEFLRASRVLILMAPLTAATRDAFGAKRLTQLSRGSYVVNVARGELLVEDDLIELLDSGHLSGAALDVFREEPLPACHRFWGHPAIRITPHVAAVTAINEAADQIATKIHELEAKRPVTGLVDRRRGY